MIDGGPEDLFIKFELVDELSFGFGTDFVLVFEGDVEGCIISD